MRRHISQPRRHNIRHELEKNIFNLYKLKIMSNDVDQKAIITTQSVNNLQTSITNTCTATCNAPTDNTTIIIQKGKAGNISVGSTCKVNAKCTISASTQQAVANKIGLAVSQTAKAVTDILNDGVISKTHLNEDLTTNLINNTTQLMESTCQASSSQSTNGTFVYVAGGTIGNLNIGATGSVSADCTMKNLGKMNASSQANINANTSSKNEGMIAAIVIAMVSIILIGGIIILLIVSTGALKGMVGGGGGGKNNFDKSDLKTQAEEEGLLSGEGGAGNLEGELGALEGEAGGLGALESEAGGLGGLISEAESLA